MPAGSRLRDRHRIELVAADLGDRLERPPGAVHVPREVRQPVGAAQGIGQRRARRDHRDRVVEDRVVLDDVVIDRDSRDGLVSRRGLRELADVLDRVADPEGGEVHHGVAHVGVLEVDQARDAAVREHELERVVRDEPRGGVAVLWDVVAHPSAEEPGDRIGRKVLHQRVVERLHLAPVAPERRCCRVGREVEPGIGRGRERDGVDAGEDLEVVVGTRARSVPSTDERSTSPRSRSITGTVYGSSQSPYACGTGTPYASSRSWVATSSAIRYGITILGSRSPAAVQR